MRKLSVVIATTIVLFAARAQAQLATFDAANVVQSTISAQEAITQTAQQLQQYQAQLQQLQNQVQNTTNPGSFQWDNANTTINNVLAGVNTLKTYENGTGGLSTYLNQYSDTSQYKSASCIGTGGCSSTQIQALNASQTTGSDSEKAANDNMLLNLDAQQKQLQSDAANVAVLQQNAQTSTGQMQALQAANQLASNLVVQLMQIRSLMIAQQTAEATRAETVTDREAQQEASQAAFVGNQPSASTPYHVLNYTGASQ